MLSPAACWGILQSCHVFPFFSSTICITYTTLAYIYMYLYIRYTARYLAQVFIVGVKLRPGGLFEKCRIGADVHKNDSGVYFVALMAWHGWR